MAWEYAHPPKKPKRYTFQGWQLANAPGSAVSSIRKRISTRRNPGARFGKYPTSVSGSNTSTISGTDTSSDYPAFYDPYGDLLSRLSSMKASDIAGLKANLTGREGAIQKLYADQLPLVEQNYGTAIKEAQDVNNAVANRLGVEGQSAQGDLLSKLSLINAPQGATDLTSGDLAKYYSGLGGANYAMDAGDVQRLLGRSSEEKTYLTKQPGIVAQQLEEQYGQDLADLMKSYSEQEFGLRQQQGQSRADYEQNKFEYGQTQKDKTAAAKQDAEDRYWENYWKKRDEIFKRWEVQQTLGQKKAADKSKAEIAALDNQAKLDVANIRAGATVAAAETRAGATVTAAGIRADASGNKAPSGADRERARKNALAAVLRPDGQVRYLVKYGDNVTIAKINAAIKAAGISPTSPAGADIRNYVLTTISGRSIIGGGTYVRPRHGKKPPKRPT